jgi:hypothetical protein
MHRPQRPQAILTAALFRTDTGYELRIGFNDTNLIHSELSRSGHAPLLLRADDAIMRNHQAAITILKALEVDVVWWPS